MNKNAFCENLVRHAAGLPASVSLLWHGMGEEEPWAQYRADERVVSASTIKAAIMLCALEEIMHGRRALIDKIQVAPQDILPDSQFFEQGPGEYTLDVLLRFMMIVSDNSCTNVLIRELGMERLNRFFADIGLVSTRLERVMLDYEAMGRGLNNYVSARDQWRLYSALYHRRILTPELCSYALEVLGDNREFGMFFRYFPRNLPSARKTGGLTGLAHDSGVIYYPRGDFYLGIFIEGAQDAEDAKRWIGRMARDIFYFVEEEAET